MVTWLAGRLWINKLVVVSSCCGSTDTHGYISLYWKRVQKKKFFFCVKCKAKGSRQIFACCFYMHRTYVQKRSLCFRWINRMHRRKVTSQRPHVVTTGCYWIQICKSTKTVNKQQHACTSHAELLVAWHANTLAEAKRGKTWRRPQHSDGAVVVRGTALFWLFWYHSVTASSVEIMLLQKNNRWKRCWTKMSKFLFLEQESML